MTKILVLAGEPASGKSTIMRTLLDRLPAPKPYKNLTLTGCQWWEPRLIVLGTYGSGERFPGTDRLSMAASTAAVALLQAHAVAPSGDAIAFEGDRLLNDKVLSASTRGHNTLHLFAVRASPDVLATRRAARRSAGNTQNPSWVKGRATKVAGILARYPHRVMLNDDPADAERHADELLRVVRG